MRSTFIAVNIAWPQIPDGLLRPCLSWEGSYSLRLLFMSRVSVDAKLYAAMYLACSRFDFFYHLEEGALAVSSGVMPSWGICNVSADANFS